MPVINGFSANRNYYKTPVANQKPDTPPKKTISKTNLAVVGTGLTLLAAGGVYIASKGRHQSVDKVFSDLQKATSFMPILEKVKMAPKNFKKLLFKITDNEEMSKDFIREMIAEPRKSKSYVRILNKKIGGEKELSDWMLRPRGYQEAYYRFTKDTYEAAKHPDDLMKLSPNWNIWKMKDKFGSDFTFGELPKEFNGTDGFRRIFEGSMYSEGAANVEGIQFGAYINGGLSGKGVRPLEAGGKKYILKYQAADRYHSNPDLKDDTSMKSDSAFLNAQLERYLGLNGYKQGPKLKFFDYKTNAALYEMSEGVHPEASQIHDILNVNEQLKDLNNLGVYYNDVNCANFFVKNGVMSFIDSGESSFVDFFRPGVAGYHFTLPNLNGRSISDTAAAINLAKN